MAIKVIEFTTSVFSDPSFGTSVSVNFTPSSVDVTRGDTVRFKWDSNSGSDPNPVISGFSSSVFTSTSFLNFSSVGQTLDKVVKSDASFITDTVTVSGSFNGVNDSDNVNIRVLNPVDNVPDQFYLGSDRTGLPTNRTIELAQIRCTGIANATVTCSISNTSYYSFRVNGGSWRTSSVAVSNTDRIDLRITTPGSFSNTQTCTLSLGSVSDTISVTTGNQDAQRFIPFPKTSYPVSLKADVAAFFGQYPVSSSSTAFEDPFLTDYRRGGDFVPDIAENNAIPTSVSASTPIKLSQFLTGVGTSFYFETFPPFKGDGADVLNSSDTLIVAWTEGIDFKMGYGYVGENAEYRITLRSYEVITGSTGAGTLSIQGVDYTVGTWDTGGFSITVSLPVSQGSEGSARGELLMEARVFQDNNTIVSAVVPFNFGWYSN